MANEVQALDAEDKKVLIFLAGAVIGFLAARWTTEEPTAAQLLKKRGLLYLIQVIEEWRPVNCKKEYDYQIALHNYLLGRFSEDDLLVEREYGIGSSRVDIVVERNYAIEMKADLSEENEIKRLKSQVAVMRENFEGVLVVLCGNTPEDVERDMRRDIRAFDKTVYPPDEELSCDVVVILPGQSS